MSLYSERSEEYKIGVVGGGGVGKSALTVQFIQNVFVEEYDPTIEDCYRKTAKVDEKPAFLEILDTAGQEEYKALRDQYMRNGDGFMLVFSVIDRKTFVEIEDFYKQIMKIKEKDRFPLVLVGNKCDLAAMREVSADEAREYARNRNIPYLETSAKTRKNVEESFHQVVKEIRCTHAKPKKNPKNKKQACVIE